MERVTDMCSEHIVCGAMLVNFLKKYNNNGFLFGNEDGYKSKGGMPKY